MVGFVAALRLSSMLRRSCNAGPASSGVAVPAATASRSGSSTASCHEVVEISSGRLEVVEGALEGAWSTIGPGWPQSGQAAGVWSLVVAHRAQPLTPDPSDLRGDRTLFERVGISRKLLDGMGICTVMGVSSPPCPEADEVSIGPSPATPAVSQPQPICPRLRKRQPP